MVVLHDTHMRTHNDTHTPDDTHTHTHTQTRMNTPQRVPPDTTGWRRPTGCLKLQVILRKRATDYRAVLQKMTYKDKASYESSPPCTIRVI